MSCSPRASSTRRSCPAWSSRRDLPAMISLRTKNAIAAIEPEHPATARGSSRSDDERRRHDVRIASASRGSARTLLRVNYGNGQWTTLEFFVTEPLETVIKKRAAFLVSHHQHKDPSEVVRRRLQRLGSEERNPPQSGRSRRAVRVAHRRERRRRQRAAGVPRVEERVPAGPDRDREPRALHQQVPLGRDADDGQGKVSLRHLRHPQLQGQPRERGRGTQRPVPRLAHLRLPAHRDALPPDVSRSRSSIRTRSSISTPRPISSARTGPPSPTGRCRWRWRSGRPMRSAR